MDSAEGSEAGRNTRDPEDGLRESLLVKTLLVTGGQYWGRTPPQLRDEKSHGVWSWVAKGQGAG